mmetsp:Transcript_6018/g.8770  ORF Transcript_6018/g.8770 Transcript_6018/m.8770 type:complete len:80 (-) Transcript_6018:8-247(-)
MLSHSSDGALEIDPPATFFVCRRDATAVGTKTSSSNRLFLVVMIGPIMINYLYVLEKTRLLFRSIIVLLVFVLFGPNGD